MKKYSINFLLGLFLAMSAQALLFANDADFHVPDEKDLLKEGKSGGSKEVSHDHLSHKNDHFEKNMKKGSQDPRFAVVKVKNRDIEKKEYMYVYKSFNIRTVASLKSDEFIARVPMGNKVELDYLYDAQGALEGKLQSKDGVWAWIKTQNGKAGFIPYKYLKMEKPKIIIRDRDVFLNKPIIYYVTATQLYMRDEANQESYSLTLLNKNDKLIVSKFSDETDYIDGKEAKWAYGKAGEYEGWVFAGYLSKTKKEDFSNNSERKEDSKHILNGSEKYVKAKILHLRDEPSKFGTIIGAIPFKTEVTITARRKEFESISGKQSIWVQIETQVSGTKVRGWVFGGFLTEIKGSFLANDDIDKPFIYPLGKAGFLTSNYGYRRIFGRRQFHTGLDLAAPAGTPIYAAGDGTVFKTKNYGRRGYGIWTMVEHDNGLYTSYSHQLRFGVVKPGQKIKAGDIIGYVGTTGNSTGNHLHFEVRKQPWGGTFNPYNYFVKPDKL